MKRVAPGAIPDLMSARGAIRNDQGRGIGAADLRQQRELGHLDRGLVGVGAIAEGAGHAAAARFDGFDGEIRNKAQNLFDRLERAKRFLMTVAVHNGLRRHRAERQAQAAGLRLARQKFLEQ